MIKAIFFDFDGVIVESVDIKTNAFVELFESEGQDVVNKVVDYHLKNTGVSRYDKFKHIYGEILNQPLSDEKFESLCNKFAALVIDNVVMAPYVKGAREFLENYASEYKCVLISATPQKEIEYIVSKKNITHFFMRIYGAPNNKRDVVRDILISERLEPARSLYIGDALSDYLAAKENSVKFIARVREGENVFSDVDCQKVKDLTNFIQLVKTS